MELSSIFSAISLIMQAIEKLAFVAVCFYYGNIAFKGWRGQKNLIFRIVLTIILGLIAFFGGMILKEYLGFDFVLSEFLTSLAVALICFVLISFISTAFEVKNKYATKMDISAVIQDLKELKIQVAKITKALEDEKIVPKELTEEDIKLRVRTGLEEKGMKKFSIDQMTKYVDYWAVKLSNGKIIIVDAYTGAINEVTEAKNPFKLLYTKPLFTAGVILSLIFLGFLLSNLNQEAVDSFTDAFDFSFIFGKTLPKDCVKTSTLLEALNQSDISTASVNNTLLNKSVYDGSKTFLVSSMTRSANYGNKSYIIAISYEYSISSVASEITSNPTENIYKVRVCNLKPDYTVCECIGKEQTDPLFTVPYLIKLGLITDAVQELIFSGLSGILGI